MTGEITARLKPGTTYMARLKPGTTFMARKSQWLIRGVFCGRIRRALAGRRRPSAARSLLKGGIVDYGFAPGRTAQDKRARRLFVRRANTKLVATKSLVTVRGFANHLLTSPAPAVTRPIDDAL